MRPCTIFTFLILALTQVLPKEIPPNPTDMPLSSRDLVRNSERMRAYIKALNSIKVLPSDISKSSGTNADLLIGNERIPVPRNQKGLDQITKIRLDRSKLQRYLDILNFESATKAATIEIDPDKVMEYVKILEDMNRSTDIPNGLIYKSRIKMMRGPSLIRRNDQNSDERTLNEFGSARVLRNIEQQSQSQELKINEGVTSINSEINNNIKSEVKRVDVMNNLQNNTNSSGCNDYQEIDYDVSGDYSHDILAKDAEKNVSQDEYFLQNYNANEENVPYNSALEGEIQYQRGASNNSFEKSNAKENSNINDVQGLVKYVVNSVNMDREKIMKTGNYYTHSSETEGGLSTTTINLRNQEFHGYDMQMRDNKNNNNDATQLKDANVSLQVNMSIPIPGVTQPSEIDLTEAKSASIRKVGINGQQASERNALPHGRKDLFNGNGLSSIGTQNINKDSKIKFVKTFLENNKNQIPDHIVQPNGNIILSNEPKNELQTPFSSSANTSNSEHENEANIRQSLQNMSPQINNNEVTTNSMFVKDNLSSIPKELVSPEQQLLWQQNSPGNIINPNEISDDATLQTHSKCNDGSSVGPLSNNHVLNSQIPNFEKREDSSNVNIGMSINKDIGMNSHQQCIDKSSEILSNNNNIIMFGMNNGRSDSLSAGRIHLCNKDVEANYTNSHATNDNHATNEPRNKMEPVGIPSNGQIIYIKEISSVVSPTKIENTSSYTEKASPVSIEDNNVFSVQNVNNKKEKNNISNPSNQDMSIDDASGVLKRQNPGISNDIGSNSSNYLLFGDNLIHPQQIENFTKNNQFKEEQNFNNNVISKFDTSGHVEVLNQNELEKETRVNKNIPNNGKLCESSYSTKIQENANNKCINKQLQENGSNGNNMANKDPATDKTPEVNFVRNLQINSQQMRDFNFNESQDSNNPMRAVQKMNVPNGQYISPVVPNAVITYIPRNSVSSIYFPGTSVLTKNLSSVNIAADQTNFNNGWSGRQELICRQIRKNSIGGGECANEPDLEYFPLNPKDELIDLSILQGIKNDFSYDSSNDRNNKIIFSTPTKPPFMYDSWYDRVVEKLEKSEMGKPISSETEDKYFSEILNKNLNHIHVDKGALSKIIGKALFAEGVDKEQSHSPVGKNTEDIQKSHPANMEETGFAPVSISSQRRQEATQPVYPRAMEKWKEKSHSSNRRSVNEFDKSSVTTASELNQVENSDKTQNVNILFPKTSLKTET